jgi:hypothetical protein
MSELEQIRALLNSMPADCLGTGTDGQMEWSRRDEVLDGLTKAIAAHARADAAERRLARVVKRLKRTCKESDGHYDAEDWCGIVEDIVREAKKGEP